MKKTKNIKEYSDKDWEDLSSILSDEKNDNIDLAGRFMADDSHNTIKYWKELSEMNNEKEINVDKAWSNLYTRLHENRLITGKPQVQKRLTGSIWFRIAAVTFLLIGIGTSYLYLENKGVFSRNSVVETSENEKNLQVTLPDGSTVILNRNTKLSYRNDLGRNQRNVVLSGEAFFEITPDAGKPFIVDAGKASVKVVGTSFNIITSNSGSAVEVYVKTGNVMLSDNSGSRNLELDPGFIGTMDSGTSEKRVNNDPNYMAWNTNLLVYDGQTLEVVFSDLKKVYNMNITVDDPGILEKQWTSPIQNQPEEKIIRLICASFALSYTKDGNVYHLSEK